MIDIQEFKDLLQVEGVNAKGFGTIPKLVMQDMRLTIESKSIYSYFCTYAGAGTTAFPSVPLILKHLRISEKRFYKHLGLLKKYGYIKIQQQKVDGKYSRNIYTLCVNPVEIMVVPSSRFACTQIGSTQNDGSNINSLKNKQSLKNNLSIERSETDPEEQQQKNDRLIDISKCKKELSLEDIRTRLQIDILQERDKTYFNLAELIYEVLSCTAKTIKINGEPIPTDLVKHRYNNLHQGHLEYVIDNMSQQTQRIKNIRQYLITALYNSYSTIDVHYRQRTNEL